MKRIILTMLCLGAIAATQAGETCVKQEHEYYGVKYYNRCACSTFSHPDVAEMMKPLGIATESRWVACSTFDGAEWCVCGVRLSWQEKPETPEACEATKKEVKQLTEKLVEEKKDFGVSAPLICPRD